MGNFKLGDKVMTGGRPGIVVALHGETDGVHHYTVKLHGTGELVAPVAESEIEKVDK